MLTIFSGPQLRTCDGLNRRDFLRVGTLGLTSLSLPALLAARARAAGGESFVRDKSVVVLYLSGGASHIETFDPKMTAPAEIRSVTGELKTPLAGVTFGGTFPELAARADRLAVVRSFHHPIGGHEQAHVHVLTGGTDPKGAGETGHSMGSFYSRLRGANHPSTGMPSYVLMTENEVDGQYANERNRIAAGSHPGTLGPAYAPFDHRTADEGNDAPSSNNRRNRGRRGGSAQATGSVADDMKLSIAPERFADRQSLLAGLDRISSRIDATGAIEGVDKFNGQAVNLMLGGAADAFNFRREDPRLVERYDTSGIKIGHKKFRPSTLGHQMLVARRLCEAGCGFVTIHSAGWDMHADGNNPGIVKGMHMLGTSLDRAVSAFLDDVQSRGLSERILLVITGDFGRTPKVNNRGGRDHWARLCTLAFAGGGLRMGQVLGDSARGADVPAADPVDCSNLMATIMHTLFDPGILRLEAGIPRDLLRLVEEGVPIPGLA